ncbi:hypothetical protein MF621_004044 (plasmid) [Bacillus velezensis]|uniref:hypothetical protein n=1 Tax=Bacillus velezensis TaxID=492670 RepID=UPI002023D1E6|nr:hypothetical protein [Bacillus velezensis]URJ76338.1 hypothetical protein MF619_004082 [Bacillus velezensis]URJ80458.1 hypothetical protein MF621_004044 [Bacillus velezensis]
MRDLESLLLMMWAENGVEEIYKYKNRIKSFREPLANIELINDLSCGEMFADINDVASHKDASPVDYKVSISTLVKNRCGQIKH